METSLVLKVSELHVPGYSQSKLPFILQEEDLIVEDTSQGGSGVLTKKVIYEETYTPQDYESLLPYQNEGCLLHRTNHAILNPEECHAMVQEAERVAERMNWTTNRHGNYPTCDLPLVELPETLTFLKVALVERIYPLLRSQFGPFLPDPSKLVRLRTV